MKRANDIRAQYQLAMDEQGILLAASHILERRLQRQGAITDPSSASSYLTARCAHLDHEVFGTVFLDTRHCILATEHLFQGTIDGCEVHPRIVAKKALDHNAAAVIFFHNHPSGNPEPSAADRAITDRLKQALALLDIRVLDHLVIAGTSHVSMASRGGCDHPLGEKACAGSRPRSLRAGIGKASAWMESANAFGAKTRRNCCRRFALFVSSQSLVHS